MTADDRDSTDRRNLSARGRRRRTISEDEAQLWAHLTSSMTPLTRAKPRVSHVDPPPEDAIAAKSSPPRSRRPKLEPAPPAPLPAPAPKITRPHSRPAPSPPPPIAGFERRVVRKVATGRIEIDARLDLHGMTQEAARGRLRAFLLASQRDGFRLVLVITGKGRERDDDGPDLYPAPGRGILRRLVPLWLSETDLRAVVVSHAAAHSRHGGVGALYVRLRRGRGQR